MFPFMEMPDSEIRDMMKLSCYDDTGAVMCWSCDLQPAQGTVGIATPSAPTTDPTPHSG